MVVTPPMFDDFSMVRMGREADDVVQVMRAEGDIRTGVSSPKRYLWADDASWLEGANWYMADPADRCQTRLLCRRAQGPLPPFIHEDDRDFLLEEGEPKESEYASRDPAQAAARPATLMTAALYEMLCQAYTYVNSMAYRNASGDGRTRPRNPHPHAQLSQRHDPGGAATRCKAQGSKAIKIFAKTLGKSQRVQAGAEPEHRRGQRRAT